MGINLSRGKKRDRTIASLTSVGTPQDPVPLPHDTTITEIPITERYDGLNIITSNDPLTFSIPESRYRVTTAIVVGNHPADGTGVFTQGGYVSNNEVPFITYLQKYIGSYWLSEFTISTVVMSSFGFRPVGDNLTPWFYQQSGEPLELINLNIEILELNNIEEV